MNLPRINLIVILLLGFGIGVNSQDPPKAVLVDEHANIPCDSMARLDHFYSDLHQTPNSMGFVIIANSSNKRRESAFRERMIENYTRFRGFDPKRIKIVRASSGDEMRISFWRVPAGASEPQVDADQSYEIPSTNKLPFVFGSEERSGHVECSEAHVDIFARFLKANPTSRANLVFRDKSERAGKRRADWVVSNLVRQYGIARKRIRVFIVRPEARIAGAEPITEYWYLP